MRPACRVRVSWDRWSGHTDGDDIDTEGCGHFAHADGLIFAIADAIADAIAVADRLWSADARYHDPFRAAPEGGVPGGHLDGRHPGTVALRDP